MPVSAFYAIAHASGVRLNATYSGTAGDISKLQSPKRSGDRVRYSNPFPWQIRAALVLDHASR